jgi:hypothetical protein
MGTLLNCLGFNIINVGNFKPFGNKTFWTLVHGCEKVLHVGLILPNFSIPISCINKHPFLSLIGGRMFHHQ